MSARGELMHVSRERRKASYVAQKARCHRRLVAEREQNKQEDPLARRDATTRRERSHEDLDHLVKLALQSLEDSLLKPGDIGLRNAEEICDILLRHLSACAEPEAQLHNFAFALR